MCTLFDHAVNAVLLNERQMKLKLICRCTGCSVNCFWMTVGKRNIVFTKEKVTCTIKNYRLYSVFDIQYNKNYQLPYTDVYKRQSWDYLGDDNN